MIFNLEEVEIVSSSLGIFGTGEKIVMVHKPTNLKVQRIELDRFLRHRERLELIEELKQKVESL